MDAKAVIEPGQQVVALEEVLDQRVRGDFHGLITEIMLNRSQFLYYEQVSRTPVDRPLVCVAVSGIAKAESENEYRVVLGGFGASPLRIEAAETSLREGSDIDAAADAVRRAYASADDAWASGEYRAHTAAVLVKRIATEVAT
jgi:CO/xanthine dehydrogenase FAD-binding subunit